MHNGEYIRTVRFDKAVRGYNKEDVDMFLEEIADDVDRLIEQNRLLSERINSLSGNAVQQPTPVDNSGSIEQVQSILISAQRFSDQIINEANEKAVEILEEANSKAKEIDDKVGAVLAAFEKDIAERKANADKEVNKMLSDAAIKSEGIITAAHDSVARQQMLFEKLKVEASEFKKILFDNHKQQLELLQKFPDSVPYDPEKSAKAIEFIVDSEPDFRSFIPSVPSEITSVETFDEEVAEDISTDLVKEAEEPVLASPETAEIELVTDGEETVIV